MPSYIGRGCTVPGDADGNPTRYRALPIELLWGPPSAMRPLIVVVVLLLVAGCGANTRPTPPYAASATPEPATDPTAEPTLGPTPEPEARADPTVVAQGFTADAESNAASYAVVIENPNSSWVPRFVDVSITFLDADGAEIATDIQTITGLLPESETAVAGEAVGAGEATEMEVEIEHLNGLPSEMRSSLEGAGQYEYEGVQTAQGPSAASRPAAWSCRASRAFRATCRSMPSITTPRERSSEAPSPLSTRCSRVSRQPSRRAPMWQFPTSRRLACSATSDSGADRDAPASSGGIRTGSCVECLDGEVA